VKQARKVASDNSGIPTGFQRNLFWPEVPAKNNGQREQKVALAVSFK
jgi:hypothetical protein